MTSSYNDNVYIGLLMVGAEETSDHYWKAVFSSMGLMSKDTAPHSRGPGPHPQSDGLSGLGALTGAGHMDGHP